MALRLSVRFLAFSARRWKPAAESVATVGVAAAGPGVPARCERGERCERLTVGIHDAVGGVINQSLG